MEIQEVEALNLPYLGAKVWNVEIKKLLMLQTQAPKFGVSRKKNLSTLQTLVPKFGKLIVSSSRPSKAWPQGLEWRNKKTSQYSELWCQSLEIRKIQAIGHP
jgi:hypothetical protein